MNPLGTRRTVVPMLTHVDNLGNIDANTERMRIILANTDDTIQNIESTTRDINQSNNFIMNTVGTTEDAATATTVIGLLKSISNKLTTF